MAGPLRDPLSASKPRELAQLRLAQQENSSSWTTKGYHGSFPEGLRRQDGKDQGSVRRSSSRTWVACKDRLDELTVADWRRLLNLPCRNAMRGNQRSPWYDGKCAAAKAADWRRSSTFRRLPLRTSRRRDWATSSLMFVASRRATSKRGRGRGSGRAATTAAAAAAASASAAATTTHLDVHFSSLLCKCVEMCALQRSSIVVNKRGRGRGKCKGQRQRQRQP